MYLSYVENVITEYLNNPKTDYAVMLNGEWGSGKTHFLVHNLSKIMKEADVGRQKRRKYVYISLYGLKSIADITKEILYQYTFKKGKKVEAAGKVIDTVTSIFSASVGPVNIDLKQIKDMISKYDLKDWIICFDDFERVDMPVYEVMGFINKLVESNGCKVIILANEREIGKQYLGYNIEEKHRVALEIINQCQKYTKDAENKNNQNILVIKLNDITQEIYKEDIRYSTIKEKTIGVTVLFLQDLGVVFDQLLEEMYCDQDWRQYLRKSKDYIIKMFNRERKVWKKKSVLALIG